VANERLDQTPSRFKCFGLLQLEVPVVPRLTQARPQAAEVLAVASALGAGRSTIGSQDRAAKAKRCGSVLQLRCSKSFSNDILSLSRFRWVLTSGEVDVEFREKDSLNLFLER
jgi:hypothetical protein